MNKKQNILVSWLGITDIRASKGINVGNGPILQAIKDRSFDYVAIISDINAIDENNYLSWLKSRVKCEILISHFTLSNPTEYSEIFEGAKSYLEQLVIKFENKATFTFHLSPGTPAMTSVWIILAKTLFPAILIQSSIESGVKTVSLPFEIYADFIENNENIGNQIAQLTDGNQESLNAFSDIITKNEKMKLLIAKASKIAKYDIPILIQGESGTGKELFARAIHNSSGIKNKPFIAVNCGAIPKELFESEFFGYKKGSFTGAIVDKNGFIEEASGGTLFLDEIGEMPLVMQVKLLRILQEGVVRKIGDTREIKIQFNVIAATNKNLLEEMQKGNFREDLFHRIAIGTLLLPPLRQRKEDINLLTDFFLSRLNKKYKKCKYISISARNLMVQHPWPGNIRELLNSIQRFFIWSYEDAITDRDVMDNLFPAPVYSNNEDGFKNRELGGDFSLNDLLKEVEIYYIKKALSVTDKKVKAAELLGYKNHQTLNNKIDKLGLN